MKLLWSATSLSERIQPAGVLRRLTLSITLAILLLLLSLPELKAQQWVENIRKGERNFYTIQRSYYRYHDSLKALNPLKRDQDRKEEEEEDAEYTKFKRWEWFMEPRVFPSGDITLPQRRWQEFKKYIDSRAAQQQNQRTGSIQALGNWTALGPFNVPPNGGGLGRINFVRFDPNNANNIWVATPAGGLWKSTNAGASWSTSTDQLTILGCTDLAFDQGNSNIIYLATGDGEHGDTKSIGVLKSTNGGATWNPTGLTFSIYDYVTIHKLAMHPTNSSIIFAATSQGLYKTSNGGTTWTMVHYMSATDIEFKPGSTTVLYAVGSSGQFIKSTDTGATFTTISSGLPVSNVGRCSIAVSPDNANYVYYLASQWSGSGFLGLYRSTNSGASFTARSTTPNILGWEADGSGSGGQGWYDLALNVNPSEVNDVYVGGVNHWRSQDGGTTWECKGHWWGCCNVPYVHADVHALEFLDGSSTTIFSANDGGLFKSTNNMSSWTDMSNGLAISQMYRLGCSATNPNFIVTGLQDNGTNRHNTTWDRVFGGDGMECAVDYNNPNIFYVSYQNGVILRTPDNGASWSAIVRNDDDSVHGGGAWITPYVLHPTNSSTILVAKIYLYRSTDSGQSWTQVSDLNGGSAGFINALSYAPSNPNYIYAAGYSAFLASTDGNNFVERPTAPTNFGITSIAVSNTDPNKVWVTSSGYADGEKVYASTDAGVTWTNYSTGLPNLPVNTIVYQNGSNDALYVGTDVGVYYRNNAMSSWVPYFNGLPNVIVSELEIQYSSGKIRAATFGRGLWESNILPGCTPPSKQWLGIVSNAWEDPANWSCGTLPDANTDVIINSGTVTLSSNQTVRSFTVKAGVNFTVVPGNKLTINH